MSRHSSSHWITAIEELANTKVMMILVLILWVLAPGYLVVFFFAPDMFAQFDAIKITILAATFAGLATMPFGGITFAHLWEKRSKYGASSKDLIAHVAAVTSTGVTLIITGGNVLLQYFLHMRSFKTLIAGVIFGELLVLIYFRLKDRG